MARTISSAHTGPPPAKKPTTGLIREWLSRPARHLAKPKVEEPLAVSELILAYWKCASKHYGFDVDRGRGDDYCLRDALQVVRSLYGRMAAKELGPRALKTCRQKMVEKGWSRRYINAQIDHVRRMFRWAAEEELLPGSIYQDLRAVTRLCFGKTEAREKGKVQPVPPEHIDATLPYMPPVVADMVRLQLVAGCRPEEVCVLRPMDVEQSEPSCWVYRPGSDLGDHGTHKTAHRDHDRLILLGPKAQVILRPYLDVEPSAYCFSPARPETRRNALRRASHKSSMTPSQKARRRHAARGHRPTPTTPLATGGPSPVPVGWLTGKLAGKHRTLPRTFRRARSSFRRGVRIDCATTGRLSFAPTASTLRKPCWTTARSRRR